jgi:1,4-dihydroxy-6-naphthoate synthase
MIELWHSPCPNDTFLFYAFSNGKIPFSQSVNTNMEDIQTLNELALAGKPDIGKISFSILSQLESEYVLLPVGAALGFGNGPKLVAKEIFPLADLTTKRVAIPGKTTTAAYLFRLLLPPCAQMVVMPYQEILPAIVRGEVDAGVVIHEARFILSTYGCIDIVDLGAVWEKKTQGPIPLGGLVARRSLGTELIAEITTALQNSLAYAKAYTEEVWPYLETYSQEKERHVIQQHLDLYVNHYTEALDETAIRSIDRLRSDAAFRSESSMH